jgi:hypothetical protein
MAKDCPFPRRVVGTPASSHQQSNLEMGRGAEGRAPDQARA